MATRRHRRVSHISPDTTKIVIRPNQRQRHTSPEVIMMTTKRNQRESHNCPDASKRIAMFDTSTSNGRAKNVKGQNEVHKPARYCPCHLLRNAHRSTVKVLRIIRVRMARAFCSISRKGSGKNDRDPAHQKFAPARDSHQSDAVEDCIAFMNSSSRKYD